jgi:hypothetical protein
MNTGNEIIELKEKTDSLQDKIYDLEAKLESMEEILEGKSQTNLIFIGDDFYLESGTVMSSIYTEDGKRYDWGFVNRDLKQGKQVIIRAATPIELSYYKDKLNNLRGKQEV